MNLASCQASPPHFQHNKNESRDILIFSYLHQKMNSFLVHYIQLLRKYTGLPIGDNGEGITEELAARVWCDSDMSHIA